MKKENLILGYDNLKIVVDRTVTSVPKFTDISHCFNVYSNLSVIEKDLFANDLNSYAYKVQKLKIDIEIYIIKCSRKG